MNISTFKKTIWTYYKKNKRNLAWRKTRDPYKILVSEVMLQQTQVSRVEVKYASFLKKFPTVESLAKAKLKDVLLEWQGLGYNRRAMYLKKCAETIVESHNSKFPKDFKALCSLPGIGPATAGDIMAFAWNIPVPVIETNIRSVFIHFFFASPKTSTNAGSESKIHDRQLLPLIEKTLDQNNPREWYWALFDYGAYLKQTSNPSRKSAHHTIQSKFAGSNRQKRAAILRAILEKPRKETELRTTLKYNKEVTIRILASLQKEGLIKVTKRNGVTFYSVR